jgi:hypothetical protein
MGPKSLRLYSGRSQSFASDLTFFIDCPFRARRQTRADDSNLIPAFRVGNSKQTSMRGEAYSTHV